MTEHEELGCEAEEGDNSKNITFQEIQKTVSVLNVMFSFK
jgi:hypothetical protein